MGPGVKQIRNLTNIALRPRFDESTFVPEAPNGWLVQFPAIKTATPVKTAASSIRGTS